MPNELQKTNWTRIFNSLPVSIALSIAIIISAFFYANNFKSEPVVLAIPLETRVLPQEGVVLPIIWGDLGKKLVDAGVIDERKFVDLYQDRGQFNAENQNLLLSDNQDNIKITEENAPYLLNLFWALGLSNKNAILEQGPMSGPRYKGAGNFASIGGWTLAKGNAMSHYIAHQFFSLTEEEQVLVEKVSKNIYRPCCGNSTHFPDCNHGMAMLGLLEFMASQGASEEEMYQIALTVNSYWFPDTYLTIANYVENQGIPWEQINPQDVLSADYSSAAGYSRIVAGVRERNQRSGGSAGSCGV